MAFQLQQSLEKNLRVANQMEVIGQTLGVSSSISQTTRNQQPESDFHLFQQFKKATA